MSVRQAYMLFFFFALSFLLNWTLQRFGIHVPIIHAYMDDLICIPVLLFPTLLIFRAFIYRSNSYIFPDFYIVLVWLVLCVCFELIFPAWSNKYVADEWDMGLYGVGAVIFWFMQRPFAKQESVW